MKSVSVAILALCAVLLLAACATITQGTSQLLTVEVLNAPGSQCRGTDAAGRSYAWANTPVSTTVEKGNGPLTLRCDHEGFESSTVIVESRTADGLAGNILFGGGVGLIVDSMSGAAVEYPSPVRLVLKPDNTASPQKQAEYARLKAQLDAEAKAQAEEEAHYADEEP